MSTLLSQIRSLFRPVSKVGGSNNSSDAFLKRVKLCLLTAVAGFDNKHTKYSTRISPKWVFGDDACFLSVTDSSYVLGVADGVGGWRSYGVDPGRFSRAVMKNCERLVNSGRLIPDKLEVLIAQCYEDVLNSKEVILGSATLCIISLQRNEHRVYGASLGDSGYLVIREGHVIQRSVHQKHSFNTPFQLSCPPTLHSRGFHCDLPNQAAQTSVEVKPGDIIIVGTDGLFDNLTESMILQEVKTVELLANCTIDSLKECAKRLVEQARRAAFAPDFVSPFASEARRYGINIAGGVPGDITVILGLVIEEKSPTPACDGLCKANIYVNETRSPLDQHQHHHHHHPLFLQPNRSLSCFELNDSKLHSFSSSSSCSSPLFPTSIHYSRKLSRINSCS
ncbi:Protein phosphatase PTC7 like [Schistosoma japonicum]|uniref:Protein phosphatase n=1 Tax=Schistosoma japonicum TaxID=6182 RepID=Q5DE72_SCHJA|nr:SJCHGC06350 protein [Schistosoma japonicum]KAH8859696.1 Protein phosphatase PTC7 like [Schistosoma japonicum]